MWSSQFFFIERYEHGLSGGWLKGLVNGDNGMPNRSLLNFPEFDNGYLIRETKNMRTLFQTVATKVSVEIIAENSDAIIEFSIPLDAEPGECGCPS